MQKYGPVVSSTGRRLMPTTNKNANKLIRRGRALRRFDRGIFYIQLKDRTTGYTQQVVVGIDPGSKKEGFTVKSASHTYLNIQSDAVTHVKDTIEVRRNMRRNRRNRKTPCRKNRMNRARGSIPPSTKARWQAKLRIVTWLSKMFPIATFVVEDIKAWTK